MSSLPIKLHKFIVLKTFQGTSGRSKLRLPKGYIFSAKSRAYALGKYEKIDLLVDSDDDLFREPTVLMGVPCAMVGFYED